MAITQLKLWGQFQMLIQTGAFILPTYDFFTYILLATLPFTTTRGTALLLRVRRKRTKIRMK